LFEYFGFIKLFFIDIEPIYHLSYCNAFVLVADDPSTSRDAIAKGPKDGEPSFDATRHQSCQFCAG
jgi:hypothetical protein